MNWKPFIIIIKLNSTFSLGRVFISMGMERKTPIFLGVPSPLYFTYKTHLAKFLTV